MTDLSYYKAIAETLDLLPERVVRYRLPDLTIVYCNVAWAAWYELTPDDVIGLELGQFLSQDGLAGMRAQLARLGPDNPLVADDVPRADLNAPGHWVEWVDQYVPGDEVIAVGRDVTERLLAQRELATSEARFRTLADRSADVVWRVGMTPTAHFEYVSPSVEEVLGYPPSFLLDDFAQFVSILDDEGKAFITRALRGEPMPELCDQRYRHANGTAVIGEMHITATHNGWQGVSRDVTELRDLQQRLADLALRDPLTGLANRRLLKELLETSAARSRRSGLPLAVAYLDLDDFKSVNDTHGHEAGDSALCETAKRLVATARTADVVARVGGDEFVIVFEPGAADPDGLISRLGVALSAPIEIAPNIVVSCPASIGVADTRDIGHDPERLMNAADVAMFAAKRIRARSRVV